MQTENISYKRHRFAPQIIAHVVWLYIRFNLSLREVEALNSKLRRAVRTRGHFPGDDAAMKLLYLVLNHAAEEWKRPPREWFEAKT